jgi:integrase
VSAGPDAAKEAEKVRTRLQAEVDARRNPRTRATVNQLMERYLELLDTETSTVDNYASLIRHHVRPLIGHLPIGRINGEVLDSFYKELRTCRAHCGGRRYVEHRTNRQHECDPRCRQHACRPLADSSIRKIHAILSGAGKRAIRWRWVAVNPFDQAEPPSVPRPQPKSPSYEQAAAIATEAWADLDWGMLVWVAMVTGARRGELCALRWDRLDSAERVLTIASSIRQRSGSTWEKDTKTHQQRRITIDEQTVTLLAAYRRYCANRAGLDDLPGSARIFSDSPDGRTWLKPDSVSQRYKRMCVRLGWDMNFHQLRHYSATGLISSGVDVTTVAGRLGHGGGGSTTLKFYSAWVSEADQRAAGTLAARMPALPAALTEDGDLRSAPPAVTSEKASPCRRIVADLRGAIICGALRPGDRLPPMANLAARYGVSFGTAQRAVAELRAEGLVTVSRGHRAVVVDPAKAAPADVVPLASRRGVV